MGNNITVHIQPKEGRNPNYIYRLYGLKPLDPEKLRNEFNAIMESYGNTRNKKSPSHFSLAIDRIAAKYFINREKFGVCGYASFFDSYSEGSLLNSYYLYINLCKEWDILPSVFTYADFYNVSYESMNDWDQMRYVSMDFEEDKREIDRNVMILRSKIIKNLRQCRQTHVLAELDMTPVGQLAIANNDAETGLKWTEKNQQAAIDALSQVLPPDMIANKYVPQIEAPGKPQI